MEIREGGGGPPGTHVAYFSEFVRAKRGKKSGYIHDTKYGPTVRYMVKSTEGIEIPGSFPFDFADYRCQNALGAFGTPARALQSLMRSMNTNQFFQKLEAKLQANPVELSVWVPDTGWIGVVRPNKGVFQVRFTLFTSRNEETDKPIHVARSSTRKGRDGHTYTRDEDFLKAVFRVETGPHEGSTFVKLYQYSIKREDKKWVIDKAGRDGREFYDFFAFHGIQLENTDPDECDDPYNVLPELEPILQQSGALLVVEVEKGWITKMTQAPTSQQVEVDLDTKPAQRKARRSHSPYLAILCQVLGKEAKDIVDPSTKTILNLPAWKKFVSENSLPKKELSAYTDRDVHSAFLALGYPDLAKNLRASLQTKRE